MNNHNHRPIIGNGREVYTRSFNAIPQGESFFGGGYPGLGGSNSYSDLTLGGVSAPFESGFPELPALPGGASGAASGGSGLLGGLNFNQIKGFVDRMGGIEGIMGTMTKFQKFVGTFQQMAPMMKVLFNSFSKGKAQSANTDFDEVPRKRKRRRKKSSPSGRRTKKSQKARISRHY
ncbi:hypothetical protein D3C73_424140 [compost metagenome]